MRAAWKTVRVFISSTFRDMQAERDWLVKRVFPALRQRLEPHRIHLVDIDLRWGITRQQADNDQVLGLCLQQIDESRPFFLGLLGERYGWVPSKFPLEVVKRYGWTQHQTGKSLTELEILHGVLNDHAMHGRALFCFRSNQFLKTITDEQQRRVFVEGPTDEELLELGFEEAERCARKRSEQLKELKQSIRKLSPSMPLFDGYLCKWESNRCEENLTSLPQIAVQENKLPEVGCCSGSGRIGGLNEFGNWVIKKLENAILNAPELQEHLTAARPNIRNELAEERDFHERFIENRSRLYIGRQRLQDELKAFVAGAENNIGLVTGPSGSGKSAALAKFCQLSTLNYPPSCTLIAHFVGASPRSTSLREMLRHFCAELKDALILEDEIKQDIHELSDQFRVLLAKVPADRCIVVVIDALNQLNETDNAYALQWLPTQIPPPVRLLVSCIDDPDNPDQPMLATIRNYAPREIKVSLLTDDERLGIVREIPSVAAKTLDEIQVRLLLDNEATRNPLFLIVALEEMRGSGSFEELNQRIARLPREGDTLTAIFQQVIRHLGEDFNINTVKDLLTLLACARRGLSERELLDLIEGKQVHIEESSGDLFPLLRQLRPYLQFRGPLLDFYHRHLAKATHEEFFKTDHSLLNAGHQRLATYFRDQDYLLESMEERQLRAGQPLPEPGTVNVRKVDELPWQQLEAAKISGEWDAVEQLFTDISFIEAKCKAGMVFDLQSDFVAVLRAWPGYEWYDPYDSIRTAPYPEVLRSCPKAVIRGWPNAHPDRFAMTPGIDWYARLIYRAIIRVGLVRPKLPSYEDFVDSTGSTTWPAWVSQTTKDILAGKDGPGFDEGSGPVLLRARQTAEGLFRRVYNLVRAIWKHFMLPPAKWQTPNFKPDEPAVILWPESDLTDESLILMHAIKNRKNAERARNTQAGRSEGADIVESFFSFVAFQRHLLESYPELTVMIATNYARTGAVATSAEKLVAKIASTWISNETRPEARPNRPSCLRTLVGHTGFVNAVALAHDGRTAISAGEDETVRIWDLRTGQCLRIFHGHRGSVTSVALTPDGQLAVSGGKDGKLRVWNTRTGECCRILQNRSAIRSISLTPDGRLAASTSESGERIWDVATGKCLRRLRGHFGLAMSISLSSDGRIAITSSFEHANIRGGNILRVWDVLSGTYIHRLGSYSKRSTGRSTGVRLTADGSVAISGSIDGTIRVWYLHNGGYIRDLKGHEQAVSAVDLTPDGRIGISGAEDRTIRAWDIKEGVELRVLHGHAGSVSSVVIHPRGHLCVSGSTDGTLRTWDLVRGTSFPSGDAHTSTVNDIKILSGQNRFLTASADGSVRMWSFTTGQSLETLAQGKGKVNCLAVDCLHQIAIFGGKGVYILDLASSRYLNQIPVRKEVVDAAISPDGVNAIIVPWRKGSFKLERNAPPIEIYDIKSGRCGARLNGHYVSVSHIAVSPGGTFALSAGGDGVLRFWDLRNGQSLWAAGGIGGFVRKVALSPDGRTAIVSALEERTCSLQVWDTAKGRLLQFLNGHTGWINSIGFTLDGRFAITGSKDQTVRVWQLDSGRCIAVYPASAEVTAVSNADPSGRFVCGTLDGQIQVLLLKNCELEEPIVTAVSNRLLKVESRQLVPQASETSQQSTECRYRDSNAVFKCPWCAVLQVVPLWICSTIINGEEIIARENRMRESPLLTNTGYPELKMKCSSCGKKIRLNPFVVH